MTSDNNQPAGSDVQISGLSQQINIAIFALVINTGFFKISEVGDVAAAISQIGSTYPTVGTMIAVALIGISYILFIVSVSVGLFLIYHKKDITKAMVFSLSCFFMLYLIVLTKAFALQSFGNP